VIAPNLLNAPPGGASPKPKVDQAKGSPPRRWEAVVNGGGPLQFFKSASKLREMRFTAIVLLAALTIPQLTLPTPAAAQAGVAQDNNAKAKAILDQTIQALGG
jgi:hypothetical protein